MGWKWDKVSLWPTASSPDLAHSLSRNATLSRETGLRYLLPSQPTTLSFWGWHCYFKLNFSFSSLYIISQIILEFLLRTYDLLEDRSVDDIIKILLQPRSQALSFSTNSIKWVSGERAWERDWFFCCFFIKQVDSTLPCVCPVLDHRRRQNVSDTLGYRLVCHFFLFLPHFDVICDLLLNRRTATWNLLVDESSSWMWLIVIAFNRSCLFSFSPYTRFLT